MAILLICACSLFCLGCGSEPGLDERYKLEKRIWDARMIESRIWQNPLSTDYRDVDEAIEAYRAIVEWDSSQTERGNDWSPRVQTEIRKRILRCKTALAKLCFLRFQDNAGVTYFRSGLRRHDLMFLEHSDVGLNAAKKLYDPSSYDPLENECARLIQEVKDDPVLWIGDVQIGDTLLTIPLYLARTELDKGSFISKPGHAELADEFYLQVIQTWPDSLVAQRARLMRADLYVLLERYDDAVAEIDMMIESKWNAAHLDRLTLFRAEIRAHGLGQYDEVEAVFRRLVENSAVPEVVHIAKLDLAILGLKKSNTQEAIRLLREIQLGNDVPAETATTAMLIRAIYLKNHGNWPDALSILWRICRLYPFTRGSFVAPLAILRHHVANDDMESAARAQKKTAEFYLDAIAKDSASIRYRHLLKDFLIESYLIMENPLGAAESLESHAEEWSGENGAVGMYKSAMVYLNLLDDRENGVRMLQKCLDVFPRTRYAKIIQGQIATLSTHHRQSSGEDSREP